MFSKISSGETLVEATYTCTSLHFSMIIVLSSRRLLSEVWFGHHSKSRQSPRKRKTMSENGKRISQTLKGKATCIYLPLNKHRSGKPLAGGQGQEADKIWVRYSIFLARDSSEHQWLFANLTSHNVSARGVRGANPRSPGLEKWLQHLPNCVQHRCGTITALLSSKINGTTNFLWKLTKHYPPLDTKLPGLAYEHKNTSSKNANEFHADVKQPACGQAGGAADVDAHALKPQESERGNTDQSQGAES